MTITKEKEKRKKWDETEAYKYLLGEQYFTWDPKQGKLVRKKKLKESK